MTSTFNTRNITSNVSQGTVATHIISAVATAKISSSIAFSLLFLQCALLHPSFAHSGLSRMTRICLTPVNFFTMLSLHIQYAFSHSRTFETKVDMAINGFTLFMTIKTLEWGFSKGSYYSRTLVEVDGVQRWEKVKDDDQAYRKLQESEPCNPLKLASWTLLQILSFRGLQFTYGPAISANNKSSFELLWRILRVNICQTLALSFLILTRDSVLCSPTSSILSLGVPNFPGLKLFSEALYTTCFGVWMVSVMDNMFSCLTLLVTCLHKIARLLNLPQEILELFDPKYFPSVFDSPHKSDSIAHFWGKGWHTVLQRIFLVSGGWPMGWVAKRLGAGHRIKRIAVVLGVFASSAFLHEYGAIQMAHLRNPNIDLTTWYPGSLIFFMLQPLGIFLEPFVIPLIPKGLGGGRLWMWIFGLLGAIPFRNQYLNQMQIHHNVPPLSQWTISYILNPTKA
ncbi:hypothetical protein DFH28DRAFT_1173444 [Melampsora americana]|nr:hypothetical protein DFH28DRAFT_1173444 [Melampsora americana]